MLQCSSNTSSFDFCKKKLASDGEASQECLYLWELLECSICDPRVGIRPRPPVICRSFCDSVLQACSAAFFAVDPKTQVLAPCGSRDTLCGRASKWTSNGSEFCQLSGFSVLESTDLEKFFYFDGKTTIEMLSDAWERASQTGSSQKKYCSHVRRRRKVVRVAPLGVGESKRHHLLCGGLPRAVKASPGASPNIIASMEWTNTPIATIWGKKLLKGQS
eukprot:Gb_11948 [translate_table: standard]